MCGIGMFASDEKHSIKLLQPMLNELGTRGLHSTGIVWNDGNLLHGKIENVPYYDFELPDVKAYSAIIHTRYSTSNIEYPQPIMIHDVPHPCAWALNGVITQEPFENWKQKFLYDGDNKNDAALIIHEGGYALEQFHNSSMAVVGLSGGLPEFFRNGQRPLYYVEEDGLLLVGSTKRSVKACTPKRWTECKPGVAYEFLGGEIIERERIKVKDLQNEKL